MKTTGENILHNILPPNLDNIAFTMNRVPFSHSYTRKFVTSDGVGVLGTNLPNSSELCAKRQYRPNLQ